MSSFLRYGERKEGGYMANNLEKTVRAYIHGSNISKRYIRVEEATGWLSEVYTNIYTKDDKDIGKNSYTDIEYTKMLAIAAGALYRMQRIELIHKERLDDFMKHLYKVPGTNKQVVKKYVRIGEGSIIYSIGHAFEKYMAENSNVVAQSKEKADRLAGKVSEISEKGRR